MMFFTKLIFFAILATLALAAPAAQRPTDMVDVGVGLDVELGVGIPSTTDNAPRQIGGCIGNRRTCGRDEVSEAQVKEARQLGGCIGNARTCRGH